MLIQNLQSKIDLSKVADKNTQNKILETVEDMNFESVDNTAQIEQILQNQNISNAGLESISTTLIGDGNTNTGYGTGSMGEIVYDPNITVWPDQDAYGRYIWNCTNFTLPEGVTMTPPLKCNGLYIYATTSCIINGTIDMREKRLTINGPNGITNFLDINNVKYNLAKGGNTVKGGDGGRAGGIPYRNYSIEPTESDYDSRRYSGGKASNTIYAGNINGGATSTYGTGAIAWNQGNSGSFSWNNVTDSTLYNLGSNGKTSSYRNATGALIIASQSLTIGTTGFLNCEGLEGVAAVNGTTATLTGMGHTCLMSDYFNGCCGNGGDGTIAPTGGGPITIITENFVNNGKISTAGKSITCTSNGILPDVKYYDEDEGWGVTLSGAGGGDGTFVSEAGELKIYIVGS